MTSDERRLVVAVALLVLFGSAIRLSGIRTARVSEVEESVAPPESTAAAVSAEAEALETTEAEAALEPVDLNLGDAAALETLPGIGPAKALRIIEWREAHGPFRSLADLDAVPGIGEKTIARLAPLVTWTGRRPAPDGERPATESGESDESGSRRSPAAGGAPLPGPVPAGPEAEGVLGRSDG